MKRFSGFLQRGIIFSLLVVSVTSMAYAQGPYSNSGNWLELDGVDDYAQTDDNWTLDIGNGSTEDFTIECFFFIPDLDEDLNQMLIYKTSSYALFINFNNSTEDAIVFRIYYSVLTTSYLTLLYSMDLSVGWHHIAAVYDNEYTTDSDAMEIFLDGSRIASSNAFELTPGVYNSSSAFNLGANWGAVPYRGKIDEVRISDAVRYSGLSYTVPNSDFSVDGNTRALWHFNEAVGSMSFTDATGNNNTLAGFNGAHVTPVTEISTVPNKFYLSQNFPNPFNPTTTINFESPSTSFISLKIFDMSGREVTTVVSEELPPGKYSREWNAAGLSSGVYLYRLQAGSFSETRKLMLLK